jgi:hypothetical protein
MWNPAAFIKWQEYNRHYEYNRRLDLFADLMQDTLLTLPVVPLFYDYPDYDIARLWRSPRNG